MSGPTTAMVLAAGLGTRMRPLTDTRPKALVEVGGKTLIDHTLDRLAEAGVTTAVVNVHAHADQLIAHLDARAARDPSLKIHVSDERGALLETGGGVKKARALLGEAPIWVANSDYVWTHDGRPPALARLAALWDPAQMDSLVIVVPKARTQGFETPGDFFRDEAGRLTHRGARETAPLHCFGVQIIDPNTVYQVAEDRFSLFKVWMAAQARGRLFGYEPEGFWMQVGDPAALEAAEVRLRAASAASAGV
ncbi:nucleotidyltransferase family protein [Phenylobacterium montanum]|uniref:Nucleotidyltransferase family protein n=1 Tax=Phenylobacterium montanum TaxID=2823693 RepID=A0A975FVJ6_9CAUL|nr:nucleotidyltransferase family protein [Caulobacter sp. S6]QUD86263.1 nucleotidyltransferase family protein [Caulobacter sp. S6]